MKSQDAKNLNIKALFWHCRGLDNSVLKKPAHPNGMITGMENHLQFMDTGHKATTNQLWHA